MGLTGKQIKKLVQEDSSLLEFTGKLLQLLKEANPNRIEHEVTEDKKSLDALARLLVGNEVCSAIAISGKNLLLATNRNLHLDERMTTTRNVKILFRDSQRYVLEFFDTLIYKKPTTPPVTTTKSSGPVTYQQVVRDQNFVIREGDPNIKFSQTEHNIKFPYNEDVTICLNMSLNQSVKDFETFDDLALNIEGPFLPPKPVDINPLRRRARKLMRNLGLIAHSILTRPSIEREVGVFIDSNKEWSIFLHDSLSHEMSTWNSYKTHINPLDFRDPGMKSMLNFYEYLVENYQVFKKEHGFKTSIDSIQLWCKYVRANIKNMPETPGFIKDDPKDFLDRGLKYFVDLVRVEKFVEKDAKENGALSRALVQENILNETTCLYVVDGALDDQHAEMRLLEYHIAHNSSSDYFGITKLCCGFCTLTMKQFKLADHRGSHATLFGNWILAEEFKKPEPLKRLLGDDLYEIYLRLDSETIHLPHQKKTESTKKSDVALIILESLASINSIKSLQDFGLEEYFMLPSSGSMYPSEEILDPVEMEDTPSIAEYLQDVLRELQTVTVKAYFQYPIVDVVCHTSEKQDFQKLVTFFDPIRDRSRIDNNNGKIFIEGSNFSTDDCKPLWSPSA